MLDRGELVNRVKKEWGEDSFDRALAAVYSGFALFRDRGGRLGVLMTSRGQLWEVYTTGRIQTTRVFRNDEAAKRAARVLYERHSYEEF